MTHGAHGDGITSFRGHIDANKKTFAFTCAARVEYVHQRERDERFPPLPVPSLRYQG